MLFAEGLWGFITGPAVLVVIAVTLAVAWPLGRLMASRYRCPPAAAILLVVAVGVLLALTLTPNQPGAGIPRPPHFVRELNDGRLLWAKLVARPVGPEELANIAIYFPIGFLGRLVWGGALRAIGFGLLLTAFVETCQYGVIGRVGSIADLRNNALGAFLGVVVATALIHRRRQHPS